AEEGDEDGPVWVEPFAGRFEVVTELVHEDEHDHAEREAPAPDQRVTAEGHEDRGELRQRAELQREPEQEDERRRQLAEEAAPVRAARLDRLVVALHPRLHQEPRPIHSSPPSYTSFFQSGTSTLRMSIASLQAASASWRCAALTAITTDGSPISTRPTRWWIATSWMS